MTCSFQQMKHDHRLHRVSRLAVRVLACAVCVVLGRGVLGRDASARVVAVGPTVPIAPLAPDTALLQRMLVAEDTRASDPAGLAPLIEGSQSSDAETRRIAVRALGRMERRENLSRVEPLTTDPSPAVRAEAVNALGQIAKGSAAGATAAEDSRLAVWLTVQARLRALAATESDPNVRGAIARTLGRLPYPSEEIARAGVEAVVSLLDGASADGALSREPRFGVIHGIDALLRRYPNLRTSAAVIRIAQLPRVPSIATGGASDTSWSREANVILSAIRGRVLGVAVGEANGIDPASARGVRAHYLTDFGDADPQVRRQVVALVAGAAALDEPARMRIVNAALGDPSFHVRVEGVRAFVRRRPLACGPLIAATRDSNAHVALTAIDALSGACEPAGTAAERLSQLVRALPRAAAPRAGTRGSWHYGAHAIVALARVAPDSARAALPRLVAHPVWQVRMYAANAAGGLSDVATLRLLAADRADNVRDAAVNALFALVRPATANSARVPIERTAAIDSIFMAQLARPDHQLVLDAARALEGAAKSTRLEDALFMALSRLTAERRETSRDPRMEILERIETLSSSAHTVHVTPFLEDYDPAIAERAARVLRAWGAPVPERSPRRLAPIPVSISDVARLRDARVRVTMARESGGGIFELRLFAEEAPATVNRFVTAARSGYYNGLTFHRMATNFVIQGGSPGANEYVGADKFMRDELGLRSHERGTLGISTRGRDTGDAQIFVNLIDNWRLDHDYTVFAEVVRGMQVVDAVIEGDVIARIEVLGGR
jgi:cyclophilin family peptidyl-prolyl cis-trans isomerase/HEAT repeat protein